MSLLRSVVISSILAMVAAPSAVAQPFIFYRGILNAASFAPPGVANGPIARGSIFSIFGRELGPAEGVTVSSFPLGTTFESVSIEVCQAGNCVQAIPLFVLNRQINAVMPSNAPLGAVSIRVTVNDVASNFSPATVVASSFGTFAMNAAGFGPGVVQNFTPDALPINSAAATATPGQTVVLWGTGLGAGLNADNVAPQAGDLPVAVEIWVGGRPVTVKRYGGRTPCCAGVDQLVFDLPADSPTGCYVPIQVRTGGEVVSNSISIAISADGSACSDPFNPLSQRFRQGGKLGFLLANRADTLHTLIEADVQESLESLLGDFRDVAPSSFAYHGAISLPPPGSCAVHAVAGDILGVESLPAFRSPVGALDAGAALTVGESSAERLPNNAGYSGFIATTIDLFEDAGFPATVLTAVSTVEGTGGADVGAFAVELPAAPALQFPGREGIVVVSRSANLPVTWQGGDPQVHTAVIAGISVHQPSNSSAMFLCTADAASGGFTVPAQVLQGLPPSYLNTWARNTVGYLYVGLLPLRAATEFGAPGLDQGYGLTAAFAGREVVFE